MAMPTFERKFRVIINWIISIIAGRDTTQLLDLDNPRGAFVAAATPAPKPAAATVAPAADKPAESGSNSQQKQTVSADTK
jgi:NADH dehydrogenase